MRGTFRFFWPVPVAFALTVALVSAGCSKKGSVTGPSTATGTATVYLDSTRQIIRGFGAANIVGWRPDMTAGEIQTAFGTGPGQLGFTIMRLRISPDSTQFAVNVPSAKAASAMGVTIIATPWTPPAWMKSNDDLVGGTLDTGAYAAYAAHLKAFADTMSANGVSLYAISVQNEPDANVSYESCYWTAQHFLNFMKNNAASVGVPIFMPESMNFNHSLSDPSLNDPDAAANIAFIGGHIYGTSPSPYPLAISKGKEVWMTEYLVLDTNWSAVLGTAKSINDCMNCQMSAYVWWYIVRYYGPIDENGIVT
ncbi:MAG TPA: xylanase, partial [Candidatus Kryptobacter bacterium]|nr:xylanase [Candidatus Kryptobacter bacterium]